MGASTSAMGSLADDTRWMDATEQAELVAKGEFTPVELLDAAVERIERDDAAINAVVLRWFDRAREVAASAELPDGPFRGVPFLLKDLFASMAGTPLTNGNKALAAAPPVSAIDTTLVSRHRVAGFVIAGRTNSPELGSLPVTEPEAYGPTRNPWNLDHTPGGSSGGSAAAVAAGMVPIAHASDGGGSIRIPASCCGLVGLKVSQGRISMGPLRAESGLGVEHCVSRTVRDTARLLDATHGPGVGDTVSAPPPVRPYADEVGADPGSCGSGSSTTIPATSGSTTTASTPSAPQRPCSRGSAIASNRRHRPCSPTRRSPRGSWRCGRRAWRSASRRSAPSSVAR